MVSTQAWVLHEGGPSSDPAEPSSERLRLEEYSFPDPAESEVLVEPLLGCWEGNMAHALRREPVDICLQRDEERVVVGNAGVVRVLRPGSAVDSVDAGDVCLVFCNGVADDEGYPEKIYGYDAPDTIGVLARRTKLDERQLIPVPPDSGLTLEQWAAFSLRYVTAWANWHVAYSCWRALAGDDAPPPEVWGWGGGVTFAELTLAHYWSCPTTMAASHEARLDMLAEHGITPVDRREFSDLSFEEDLYRSDPDFRSAYQAAEDRFLERVDEETDGERASIFIDFIGAPVHRATLKALARPGVLATAGWKEGMRLKMVRAIECMSWHTHVHTHYARRPEALAAVEFALDHDWAPPVNGSTYGWDEVPKLADAYERGEVDSYFPTFRINSL